MNHFKLLSGSWQQPPLDPPYETDDPRYYSWGHPDHECVGVSGFRYDQDTYLPYRRFIWRNIHTNLFYVGVERIGIEHPMYNYHVIYDQF